MILSKTTSYALNILTFMATRDEEMYPAEHLFKQLNIPRQYLRRLLTDLSKLGFISSNRGRKGGFIFARNLSEINIKQVIDAMEGPEAMATCMLGFTACIVDHPCAMHEKWAETRTKMIETLTNTTFADLRDIYQKDNNIIQKLNNSLIY